MRDGHSPDPGHARGGGDPVPAEAAVLNGGIAELCAPVGKAGQVETEKYVCGVCGFALDEAGACPRCKLQNEEIVKVLESRAFLRKVDEFVKGKYEEEVVIKKNMSLLCVK